MTHIQTVGNNLKYKSQFVVRGKLMIPPNEIYLTLLLEYYSNVDKII